VRSDSKRDGDINRPFRPVRSMDTQTQIKSRQDKTRQDKTLLHSITLSPCLPEDEF